MVQVILGAGADIECRNRLGHTALSFAATAFPQAVAQLLAAGSRADVVDMFNTNPLAGLALSLAPSSILAQCVHLLLAAKASINGKEQIVESYAWHSAQQTAHALVSCGSSNPILALLALASEGGRPALLGVLGGFWGCPHR